MFAIVILRSDTVNGRDERNGRQRHLRDSIREDIIVKGVPIVRYQKFGISRRSLASTGPLI
jgi:hypothetical protein